MKPFAASMAALALLALAAAGPLLLADSPTSFLHGTPLARSGATGYAFGGHEVELVLSRDPALDPARDALLVLAPEVGYSDEEVGSIRAFLSAGGRLLVAGDRGAGKDLLDRLDVGVRLTGIGLYTPVFDTTPDRMIAQGTGALPGLPAEVIVSGRPTAVDGGVAVLRAPEPTWLDANDNGRPDLDESTAPVAVAAVARFGDGIVLVAGDRLLFHRGDPAAQAAFLAHVAEGGRTLRLDEAHRAVADPFALTPLLSGSPGLLAGTAILMLALGIGAFAVLRPRFKRDRRAARRPTSARHPPELVSEVLSELDTR